MSITATFHSLDDDGEDIVLGKVTLDGDNVVADPADMPFLNGVVEGVKAQVDKVATMKSLPEHFRTAYRRASVKGE